MSLAGLKAARPGEMHFAGAGCPDRFHLGLR
jgi:hypothetical protein